jgi:hypothetical protein
MKLYSKVILGTIIVLFSGSVSNAQIINRLKQKATDAAERAVERKVDQELEKAANRMVENSWNSIFGGENGAGASGLPFKMNSNVQTEDQYSFDVVSIMKIESQKRSGKQEDPIYIDMHFNQNAEYTGTRIRSEELKKNESNVFIIYDFKNSAMVMLMGSNEGKFSFAYDWKDALTYAETMENEEDVNWDELEEWKNYRKIGTKTINRYTCDGYLSENDEAKSEIWVTRENLFGMEKWMGANANTKQMKGSIPSDYPYGMLMQNIYEDKKSGDKVIMTVTEVKKNANISFKMSDYPRMGMAAN